MNYFLIAIIILMDQITKYMIISKFSLYDSKPVIEGIFHLTYVRNLGAAFSILQNQRVFFIIATLVVVVGIFIFVRTQDNLHRMMKYSFSLIVAGAIGNAIDRIRYGYVVDFFDFMIWPVFNIADISIVIGAVLLCYYLIFIDKSHQ